MAVRDLGIGIGAGFNSAIKTFGDVLNEVQQVREFRWQQQEQQAAANANGAPTGVGQGQSGDQIINAVRGGAAQQDPEAAMQGVIGVNTAQSPQAAQAALSGAQQQQANYSAANAPNVSTPAPNQPVPPIQPPAAPSLAGNTPAAPSMTAGAPGMAPAGGIASTSPTTGSGAPAGGFGGASPQSSDPAFTRRMQDALNTIETSGGKNWSVDPGVPGKNNGGAVGGVMPATWDAYAQPGEDKTNPKDVQAVQQRVISHLASVYGNDPGKVATAWFSGPGNVNTDPNAQAPYKNPNASDGRLTAQQFVSHVTQAYNTRATIDSHGTVGGDEQSGTPSITTDTPVQNITAKALPAHVQNQYTFQQDPATGTMTMQKTASAADRAMASAQKAYELGDLKNAGPLMQAAMTMRQQESQQAVTKIMQDTSMSQDEKVGALGKLAGATVYKASNGSYIVPGLGPQDGNGNPLPMNYQQVAALSTFMTTPEGMQHAMDFNMQQAQLNQGQEKNRIAQQGANAETLNAQTNASLKGSQQKLLTQQANMYGASAEAQAAERTAMGARANAQAQDEANKAKINQKLSDLSDQAAKLDPQSATYKQDMDKLTLQHNILVAQRDGRLLGPSGNEKPQKDEEVEPGKMYRDANGATYQITSDGQKLPVAQAQQYEQLRQQMTQNQARYAPEGLGINTDGGSIGVVIRPDVAAGVGLNPRTKYPDFESAMGAIYKARASRFNAQGIGPQGSPVGASSFSQSVGSGGIPY